MLALRPSADSIRKFFLKFPIPLEFMPFSNFVGWKVSCAEYFPYSTYFEGRHSSASPNSAFNQLRKNSENDIANHSVGSQNVDSTISNGKSFKDLTI